MKTQEPFKWGFLRWQRMSQKQRTAVFLFLPHDPAQTTAQFSLNDRTIQPQRPHDSAPTTARFSPNDRTIQPQRPHDSAPTTARSGTGLSFPHREAASGKDKMLFPISDVEYQPAFHASLSNDR